MKYITNFDDEYFGTQYKAGDTVKLPSGKEGEGAEDQLKGAVTDGRLTKIDDGDPVTPALGADTTSVRPEADTDDDDFDAEAFIGRNLDEISDDDILNLSADQRAAVVAAENDREKPRTGLLSRLDV